MIGQARHNYYERVGKTGHVDTVAYTRQHDLDADLVFAHVGLMAVLPLTFEHDLPDADILPRQFYFDGKTPACVIEVLSDDATTVIDLCAWPVDRPEKFALALGTAATLGSAQVVNPASWSFGHILHIRRTPLDWLKAGCDGVVILDHRWAPYVLGEALGPMLAEDAHHARDLKRLLCKPPVSPLSILFESKGMGIAA